MDINLSYTRYFVELREIRLEKLKDPRLSPKERAALIYSIKKVEAFLIKHSALYHNRDKVKNAIKDPAAFQEVKQSVDAQQVLHQQGTTSISTSGDS